MGSNVQLDLNNPVFIQSLIDAGPEAARCLKALKKATDMDWPTFQSHTGFKWEKTGLMAPGHVPLYSLRLSQKYRATAFREGELLRLVALHLDHDSADKP